MSVTVTLGHFLCICCNFSNRSSTAAGDGIIRHVSNKMVPSGLISSDNGRIVQGDSASDLDPGSILTGANESGCLTHPMTAFVIVCLNKLTVRVSVMNVGRKLITLATSEPGEN